MMPCKFIDVFGGDFLAVLGCELMQKNSRFSIIYSGFYTWHAIWRYWNVKKEETKVYQMKTNVKLSESLSGGLGRTPLQWNA